MLRRRMHHEIAIEIPFFQLLISRRPGLYSAAEARRHGGSPTMNTTITPAQCCAARGLIELTQTELAEAAEVSLEALRDFEAGRGRQNRRQIEAIRAAIEAAGIAFTGEGVRWALPPLAAEESNYHVEAPPQLAAWPGRLGGEGGPVLDDPQRAAANRARVDGRAKPDPLSPDFISAARRTTERR
jgi:transcriptional regulator with XRE-family HTH domain